MAEEKITIRKYEAENPGAAVVVYAYPGITQFKLMAEIARSIGVYGKGSKAVLIDRIVEGLKGRDLVLIIDQADYLNNSDLELLRCIRKRLRCGLNSRDK
jgi:DNA transposition AAA+ family ATPase